MLKFKPITYADTDLRAFTLSHSAAILEGTFCSVLASTNLNQFFCGPFSGTSPATLSLGSAVALASIQVVFDTKKYFPVFREEPDIENVSATIQSGIDVVGFSMKPGNEFEVHVTVTESGFATSFGKLDKVALGSTGKLAARGGKFDTALIVGLCTGTTNGWVRVRVI